MAAGDKVYIADKQTLDAVKTATDSVNTKVGSTGDTGGSTTLGTLFGKLNAILSHLLTNWTAARAAKIDTIDTNASNASTKANSAATDAAAAKTNTATNNTASPSGTLSQKLSHIIGQADNININAINSGKRLKSYSVGITPSPNVDTTVMNVNGSGRFRGMVSNISHNMSAVTVTVDGVNVMTSGGAWALFRSIRFPGSPLAWGTIDELRDWGIPLEFKSSMKITVKYSNTTANDSSTGYVHVAYDLYE